MKSGYEKEQETYLYPGQMAHWLKPQEKLNMQ